MRLLLSMALLSLLVVGLPLRTAEAGILVVDLMPMPTATPAPGGSGAPGGSNPATDARTGCYAGMEHAPPPGLTWSGLSVGMFNGLPGDPCDMDQAATGDSETSGDGDADSSASTLPSDLQSLVDQGLITPEQAAAGCGGASSAQGPASFLGPVLIAGLVLLRRRRRAS